MRPTVAAVVLLVVLLYRQFGLLLMPGGRRISYGGLDIDATAPVLRLRFDNTRDGVFDWVSQLPEHDFAATLALFAMPSCPICDRIAHDAATAAICDSNPSIKFLWIDGGRDPSHVLPAPWVNAFSSHNDAHISMEIPGTPFAYLVSHNARVVAKGLVNSATDIESMIRGATEKLLLRKSSDVSSTTQLTQGVIND